MNECTNYKIPCPYALTNDNLPCFGTQENCDMWRKKYEAERPDEYNRAMESRDGVKTQQEPGEKSKLISLAREFSDALRLGRRSNEALPDSDIESLFKDK